MNTKHKLKGQNYQMPIIHLPASIQKVFGDEGSKDFVSVLNELEEAQIHRTIEKVEDKFEKRLVEETNRLEKWMFAMWVTQMLAIGGLFVNLAVK